MVYPMHCISQHQMFKLTVENFFECDANILKFFEASVITNQRKWTAASTVVQKK